MGSDFGNRKFEKQTFKILQPVNEIKFFENSVPPFKKTLKLTGGFNKQSPNFALKTKHDYNQLFFITVI